MITFALGKSTRDQAQVVDVVGHLVDNPARLGGGDGVQLVEIAPGRGFGRDRSQLLEGLGPVALSRRRSRVAIDTRGASRAAHPRL